MPSTLVIVGVCLLLVGAALLRAAWARVRGGRWAGGRYNAIADERTKPHTMYTLARARRLDLFSLVRRFPLFRPLVDAEYGSAAFVAATRPVEYEVRVSTTGLLMRPALR